MDSLTQIVLGAAVGETVLGRKVGNKAMVYGAIAGTIPDLDTLAGHFVDTVTALEIHRGFTHSLVFSLAFAPVFGWVVSKVEHRSPATWKDWSRLMFWGLFTHPLLDAFTTWGTQLFWPLDLRLDFRAIFVIDPLYTLPFLIFLIMAMRLDRASPKRRRLVWWGLGISSSYLMLCLGLKGLATQRFKAALREQGIAYRQLETKPAPFTNMLWTANVEVADAYLIGEHSFLGSRPIHFDRYPKNHALLGELAAKDRVQRLIAVSRGWYTIDQGTQGLVFNDLRFGVLDKGSTPPNFVFSYQLLEQGGGLEIREVERRPGEARELLRGLWQRILGN